MKSLIPFLLPRVPVSLIVFPSLFPRCFLLFPFPLEWVLALPLPRSSYFLKLLCWLGGKRDGSTSVTFASLRHKRRPRHHDHFENEKDIYRSMSCTHTHLTIILRGNIYVYIFKLCLPTSLVRNQTISTLPLSTCPTKHPRTSILNVQGARRLFDITYN